MLPTFAILIVIALYPLGSVFVNSFTNRVFASSEPVEFIGFENYANLLSMTVKEVPFKTDDDGEVIIDPETGKPELENPARILPREPRRYKPLTSFSIFGNRYVLGATDPAFCRQSALLHTGR